MAAKESGAVVTFEKESGVRWKAEWATEQTSVNGRRAVKLIEAGEGLYSPFKQQVRWIMEGFWSCEDAFSPMRFEKTVSDVEGRILLKERKAFDFAKGIVRFERDCYADGISTRRELQVPRDTLAIEGIALALRSLPFNSPKPFEAHLLTNEPKLYRVALKAIGREGASAPAGKFDCYKVELVPRLGLLDLFRAFLPKTYFWFATASPHFWVRYEGLESGPGTPYVTMELVKFEQR